MPTGERSPDYRQPFHRKIVAAIGATAILAVSGTAAFEDQHISEAVGQTISVVEGANDFLLAKASEITGTYPQSIRISLDPSVEYTFMSTGDSLADGDRGAYYRDVNGKLIPESFVDPAVQILNSRKHNLLGSDPNHNSDTFTPVANYLFDPSLAKIGLTLTGLIKIFKNPNNHQELASIPNLVLCVSIGTNDMKQIFAGNVNNVLEAANKINAFSSKAQQEVAQLLTLWDHIRQGKPNSALLFLGLTNTDEIPAIRDLTRGTVAQNNTAPIAIIMNSILSGACQTARERGLDVGYVNNFEAIKSTDISDDNIHPNRNGYDQLAANVARAIIFGKR